MKQKICVMIAGILLFSSAAKAQLNISIGQANLHAGKIGLGLDGITGSNDFLMKYFFNKKLAGQVIVGFSRTVPAGDPPSGQYKVTGTTIRGGLALLYHLTDDQVSPYLGAEGIFQSETEAGFFVQKPDAKKSVFVSGIIGVEYFPSERFSLGIKCGIGADIELKRDVPKENTELNFKTSTVFTGRFYFN